jgi:hypothetical protein
MVVGHLQIGDNKGGGMGSSSPLTMLLRRIGGGLPQMAPTFDYGGGGALDNDGVEDNGHWWGWRAGGPSLIDDKDDDR